MHAPLIRDARATPELCSARERRIAKHIQRFRPQVRERIRAVAARHPWIADLAVSFPALMFALALPNNKIKAEEATRLAIAGAPLRFTAQTAGVPLWLRGYPPQAFDQPIPALPDSVEFRRQIANLRPKDIRQTSVWLEQIAHAARWGDETIALWLAREVKQYKPTRRRARGRRSAAPIQLLCLWAWFSQRSGARAGACIDKRWFPEIGWNSAIEAAREWKDSISLRLYLEEKDLTDMWRAPGAIDGYEFIPLRSAPEIEDEARSMQHCVRTYGFDIADDYYRLWSVRRDRERIATLCLHKSKYDGQFPTISELSGPKNADVAPEVWLAARRWLHVQDALPNIGQPQTHTEVKANPLLWRQYWRPFWLEKQSIPEWLPLSPRWDGLDALT